MKKSFASRTIQNCRRRRVGGKKKKKKKEKGKLITGKRLYDFPCAADAMTPVYSLCAMQIAPRKAECLKRWKIFHVPTYYTTVTRFLVF